MNHSRVLCLCVALWLLTLPAAFAAPADLDPSFGTGGKVTTPIGTGDDEGFSLVVQSDGKIVLVGRSSNGTNFDFALARYSTSGALDPSFGMGGKVMTPFGGGNDESYGVALQNDGKIVVAGLSFNGTSNDFAVARYTPDGVLDGTFGTGGKVVTPFGSERDDGLVVAVQSDGKIVVAGWATSGGDRDFALVRYTDSGALDAGFGTGGKVITPFGSIGDEGSCIVLQNDGKIVVAGLTVIGGHFEYAVARYTTAGILDTGFGSGGKVITPFGGSQVEGHGVAVQNDGKIVVTGYIHNGTDYDFALARYTVEGNLDTGFGTGGKVTTSFDTGSDQAVGVAIQEDGKIVVSGFSERNSKADFALARYMPNGTLDAGFGVGGKVVTPIGGSDDFSYAVAIQSDGKIVVGGRSSNGSNFDFALVRYTSNGALDGTFGPSTGRVATPIGLGEDVSNHLAVQSDGKIVVVGTSSFGTANSDLTLVRYLSTGALDADFGGGGVATTELGATVDRGIEVALQSDGKIVAVGESGNGTDSDFALVRSTPTGALDASFGSGGKVVTDFGGSGRDIANSLAVQSDGMIIVSGTSGFGSANSNIALARYTSTGALDASFGSGGKVVTDFSASDASNSLALQSDGKILVAGWTNNGSNHDFVLVRYTATGALDGSFGSGGRMVMDFAGGEDFGWGAVLQSDGKILVTGMATIGGNYDFALVRYTTTGALDAGFGNGGKVVTDFSGFDDEAFGAAVQSDGKILVTGRSHDGSAFNFALVRYTATGSLDSGFGSGGKLTAPMESSLARGTRLAVLSDGGILVTGENNGDFGLVRYLGGTAAGEVDASYQPTVGGGDVYVTVVQPDGKTIIAGDFFSVLGVQRQNIARLNVDGSLDMGFYPKPNATVFAVAVQDDGKILLGGDFTNLQPNGGSFALRNSIARLNADGTIDSGFDPKPDNSITCLALQPDGRIVLGGRFTTFQPNGAVSPIARSRIARLHADGSVDANFDPKVTGDSVETVVVQPDGKILLGGLFTSLQPNGAAAPTTRQRIARVNADGTLDAGFDPKANDTVLCAALQADGKIVLGGFFTTLQPNGAASPTTRRYVARVGADGSLDNSFDPRADDIVISTVVQTDGRILLGGRFETLQPNGAPSPTARNYIARVHADGTLDPNFDPNASDVVRSVAVQADGRVLLGGLFTALQPNGGASVPGSKIARLLNDPATQNLTATTADRLQWLRGGTSPETQSVVFEHAYDGETWQVMGEGTRIAGGWELTGLIALDHGMIRARARTVGGGSNGSSGLVETIAPYSFDRLTRSISFRAPQSPSVFRNPVPVDFTLPEDALPGSFTINFLDASRQLVCTLTLASSQETAGDHSFTFNAANPTASPEIANGSPLPDGLYIIQLIYQDALGNPPAQLETATGIDNTPPVITIINGTFSPLFIPAGEMPDYRPQVSVSDLSGFTLSQEPAPGEMVGPGNILVKITAADGTVPEPGNQSSISFNITALPPGVPDPVSNTGDDVPQQPMGTKFFDYSIPAVDAGQVGGAANIVTTDGPKMMVIYANADRTVLANTGGPAPGGATFTALGDPVFAGDAFAFAATTRTTGAQGPAALIETRFGLADALRGLAPRPGKKLAGLFSRLPQKPIQRVATQNSIAPGTDNLRFAKLPGFGVPRRQPRMIFTGALQRGGVVKKTNDFGLWRQTADGDSSELLLRHGSPIDLAGGPRTLQKMELLIPVTNGADQRRSFAPDGGVAVAATFGDGSKGIVQVKPDGTKEVTVDSNMAEPDYPGVAFEKFSAPATASGGLQAFRATLKAITNGTRPPILSGIYKRSGNSVSAVARPNDPVPMSSDDRFVIVDQPLMGEAGLIAFTAMLKKIVGAGPKPKTRKTIQTDQHGTVAEIGLPAPGADGAVFARFLQMQVTDTAKPRLIFSATLKGKDVKASNNLGLWCLSSTGEVTLLLRTGGTIEESSKVRTFEALQAAKNGKGQGRGTDEAGFVTARATVVKNGTSQRGVLRIALP